MKSLFYRSAQWGLAIMFVYAGVMKLHDPIQFSIELGNYRLLPEALALRMGAWLPWLEIFAGLGLLLKPVRLGSWFLSAALGLGFTIFVTSAWLRGLDISCGCFGSSSTRVGPVVAFRAGAIFVIATLGLIRAMRLQAESQRAR